MGLVMATHSTGMMATVYIWDTIKCGEGCRQLTYSAKNSSGNCAELGTTLHVDDVADTKHKTGQPTVISPVVVNLLVSLARASVAARVISEVKYRRLGSG